MGAENTVTSRDLRILVEEAAEPVASENADVVAAVAAWVLPPGGLWPRVRCGRWVL